MSPIAMPVASDSQFGSLLDTLRAAPTAPGVYMLFNCEDSAHGFADAKAAADRLAREVAKVGYESLT